MLVVKLMALVTFSSRFVSFHRSHSYDPRLLVVARGNLGCPLKDGIECQTQGDREKGKGIKGRERVILKRRRGYPIGMKVFCLFTCPGIQRGENSVLLIQSRL